MFRILDTVDNWDSSILKTSLVERLKFLTIARSSFGNSLVYAIATIFFTTVPTNFTNFDTIIIMVCVDYFNNYD